MQNGKENRIDAKPFAPHNAEMPPDANHILLSAVLLSLLENGDLTKSQYDACIKRITAPRR